MQQPVYVDFCWYWKLASRMRFRQIVFFSLCKITFL